MEDSDKHTKICNKADGFIYFLNLLFIISRGLRNIVKRNQRVSTRKYDESLIKNMYGINNNTYCYNNINYLIS
jgi:hypothetical protein